MEEDNFTKQISKYNDSGLSISRLHESWLKCNNYMRRGKFKSWQFELDLIWLELYPDVLRNSDKDRFIEKNKRLMFNISKAKLKSQLFFNLMERHKFLREVQDAAGKAGTDISENEEGFE